MNRFLPWIMSLALLTASAAASAACEPEFARSAQTVTLNAATLGSGQVVRENFSIRARNGDDGQCSAILRLARVDGGAAEVFTGMVLTSASQIVSILQNESISGGLGSDIEILGLPSGSNGRAIPFSIAIPANWGLVSGTQRLELVALLVDEGGAIVDRMPLDILFTVLPTVEFRIVGVTGSNEIAQLNLGRLRSDQSNNSDPFGLRVWSSGPYSILVESQNMGRLRHDSDIDTIDYLLWMDGRPVDLRGAVPVYHLNASDALGNLHPLRIVVPPFQARAGDYSDRITITVTAG